MAPELERLVDELHDQIAPELRRLTTDAVREAAKAVTGANDDASDHEESDHEERDYEESNVAREGGIIQRITNIDV